MAYTPEQRRLIKRALQLTAKAPPAIRQSLIMAMLVETNARNVDYGDRDSEGVLQQRPSQGWGPTSESAETDMKQYLQRARRNYAQGIRDPGRLAQSVQRSAFPERYGQRADQVQEILGSFGGNLGQPSAQRNVGGGSLGNDREAFRQAMAFHLLGSASATAAGTDRPGFGGLMQLAAMRQQLQEAQRQFGPEPQGGRPLVKGGVVSPLSTPMGGGSEFHVQDAEGAPGKGGRFHAGKDWFAPAGSPVYAPWGGKVVEVKASRGNSGQVFGGVVKIRRPDGKVFVARHVDPSGVRVGQRVKPGQAIAGVTDWTGGSSHAHIEIWKSLKGGYRKDNMIDPVTVFSGRRR